MCISSLLPDLSTENLEVPGFGAIELQKIVVFSSSKTCSLYQSFAETAEDPTVTTPTEAPEELIT